MAAIFLTAEWRKLIMAQYAVDPAVLTPYLPAGTELDFYQGRCYVSLVGFLFDRVRVMRAAIPFHTRFEEINLRFYVLHRERDGTIRRGVVFIREFVPRTAIAVIARSIYEEPYTRVPTGRSIQHTADSLNVSYSWRYQKKWQMLSVEASPVAQPMTPNGEESFLTEHYWGFTRRSNGTTSQYEVRHPSWEIYPIQRRTIDVDFGALYGPQFASLSSEQTASILLAEGSSVSVLSGTRLN